MQNKKIIIALSLAVISLILISSFRLDIVQNTISDITLCCAKFSFRQENISSDEVFLKMISSQNIMFDKKDFWLKGLNNVGYENNFLSLFEKEKNAKNVREVNMSYSNGNYKIVDNTALINSTNFSVDIKNIMLKYKKPDLDSGDKPQVLIYHTHTTEGYGNRDSGYTNDESQNVVAVGNKMAQEFEQNGFKTIHIKDNFIDGNFTGGYARSLKKVDEILKKYPSIKIVLDVHRDSMTSQSGIKYKPTTMVNNKKCAQVMIVCGTNQKGLKHDNWKDNLSFALNVAKNLGSDYKNVARPVNLRADRFNTHVTPYAILLEVGDETNTVDEAITAGKYAAKSIIKTIK